jgi:thioredoxin
MIKFNFIYCIATVLLLTTCSVAQPQIEDKKVLPPKEFSEQLKKNPSAQLIDVRTPNEFSSGHLEGALNLDWNGAEFKNQAATLDKKNPVYVYCLSGGRSASAAEYLRNEGFSSVYEMDGGMMKWRAAKLPEVGNTPKKTGMSIEDFNLLIGSNKIVLVDFYADWCAPCKKMKPELDELIAEYQDQVIIKRINIEENTSITSQLQISGLPVVHIYKEGELKFNNTGYMDKATIKTAIEKIK